MAQNLRLCPSMFVRGRTLAFDHAVAGTKGFNAPGAGGRAAGVPNDRAGNIEQAVYGGLFQGKMKPL